MDDQWKVEIERSMEYLVASMDDLMHSDAVRRSPETALAKLARAREALGRAVDCWTPEERQS
jgi:hypothetical protein